MYHIYHKHFLSKVFSKVFYLYADKYFVTKTKRDKMRNKLFITKSAVCSFLITLCLGCVTHPNGLVCVPEKPSITRASNTNFDFDFNQEEELMLCQPTNITGSY